LLDIDEIGQRFDWLRSKAFAERNEERPSK
jgi:hypothetical protein